MSKRMPPPGETRATVTMFKEGHRTYERRYIDCGKPNCRKCTQPGGRVPSHGPYWYLCVPRKGKWFRQYLGKNLDTNKWIDKNGNVDWEAIKHARKHKQDTTDLDTESPGQEDMVTRQQATSNLSPARGPAHVKLLEDQVDVSRDYVQDPLPGGKLPI